MKTHKIFFSVAVVFFLFTSCKKEVKKEEGTNEIKKENVALAISGMTCEIGCAKTIQSKLSKKEGVLAAKVIFKDSIANIEFDANKTNKADLIAFVDGIAGGELYKATEQTEKKACGENCDKACCAKDAKTCKKDCKKECCKNKKA